MKTIKRAIDPLNLFNPGKVSTRLLDARSQAHPYPQLYPDKPANTKR